MKYYINSNNYMEVFLKDENIRPIVLIAPGGGYQRTSPREAGPIRDSLLKDGYHVAIIYYRESLLKKQDTIDELAGFYQLIQSSDLPVMSNKIILMGFSSGGHYMARLGVTHHLYHGLEKPYAMILAYPVISGKIGIAHEASIERLYEEISDESRKQFSLELQVSKNTPPTFLFHTVDDKAVPVENSLVFFEALRNQGVLVDLHLFHKGVHGISLGTKEVCKEEDDPLTFERENLHNQNWFKLAMSFVKQI
ncbi:MAG: alpha/beta hydrolase [Acholeplasma sp.]|nr:alpha/beta hydrolase [Acholeplasma sp.]